MTRRGARRGLHVLVVGACLLVAGACSWGQASSRMVVEDIVPGESAYVLGAEDVLRIAVWRDEDLTKEVVIRPDGKISFPLVGEVQAAGRTADSVQVELVERLTKFIPKPEVYVAVEKVLSYRVYVLGRVTRPGEYTVGHTTDVLQALSLAGGLTPFAEENNIQVVRRIRGEEVVFPFRYGDAKVGKGLEQNILLERGDVVMVP